MFFEKIETEGLAHYSYIIGSQGRAVLIDPMRDPKRYIDILKREGLQLKYIFETHRNEDYITGSIQLSELTGAEVFISGYEDLGYVYGQDIYDGDKYVFGDCTIKALHTPGHTKGHMSYILYEDNRDNPYMIFTGDCLFVGDIGRTDFYGEENLEEMTSLMYDSIFNKILPLGDDVIVNPAHGNGSACGDEMDERPSTTIGYERINNPKLQFLDKDEFIKNHGKMRIKPIYFEKMEVCNVKGAPYVNFDDRLKPINYNDLDSEWKIIDLRSPHAFASAHIPGSLYISMDNLASYLGNLLDTETNLVFLAENDDLDILKEAYWTSKRIGFDNVKGFLVDGIDGYVNCGHCWDELETVNGIEYKNIEDKFTLDIRNVDNLSDIGKVKDNKIFIPIKVLKKEYKKMDKNKKIYILCGSGKGATTAASFLKDKGYEVVVIKGGQMAINRI